jgi:hypothetical protein
MASVDFNLTLDPVFVALYTRQRLFQADMLGRFPYDLEPDEAKAYVREQALALTDELHEALQEIPWKSWAKRDEMNRPAYMEELADVFIFFMNMMLIGDVRPTELMDIVEAKIRKNIKRQADGYVISPETKCPGCHRSYDGAGVMCARVAPENANGRRKDRWCDTYGHIYDDGSTTRTNCGQCKRPFNTPGVSCSPGNAVADIPPSCADGLDNPDPVSATGDVIRKGGRVRYPKDMTRGTD